MLPIICLGMQQVAQPHQPKETTPVAPGCNRRYMSMSRQVFVCPGRTCALAIDLRSTVSVLCLNNSERERDCADLTKKGADTSCQKRSDYWQVC